MDGPVSDGPPVAHQVGVVDAPPAAARFAAYDVRAADRAGLAEVLRRVGEMAGRVNGGGGAGVTVAFGASLFDGRFGLADARPRRLVPMGSFPNDVLDPAQCHGDLLVQICAGRPEEVARIGRELATAAGGGLAPRWSLDGFRAENQTTASGSFVDRNLFGFREGASNPAANDRALMDRLVWAGDGEPAWAVGGTYQVVRLIRLATQIWDTEPVERQEAVFGRRKDSGAPLGMTHETDEPRYADDPHGRVIALDAHVRRANPRTPESEANRILRRGYSYRRPRAGAGHPDEGLIFVCFQADLERGFVTVQRRLVGEALDRYVLTFGGGYFFAPPGVAGAGDYPGRRGLIEVA
ncbi:Dyp-type peroxidase [Solwaraspora sp. WMMD1047]|uniref:Dyp-type peroxidase n=1 Tax=Solwaraspora sp. WMMD1047 TaxID=3016102 RepID=UPI002417E535|nr:Dyp-type peroxidase [Solwaraspora sp. WMMD1047]MDG4828200.1 Dyp-type peroxidase [Solwaraspora sp. WMMD1047]